MARMRQIRNTCKILVAAAQRKKSQLGRSRCIWEDNIKMYLKKICFQDVNWVYLFHDTGPVASCCGNGNGLRSSKKCRKVLAYFTYF
jgi:hypothetical protein